MNRTYLKSRSWKGIKCQKIHSAYFKCKGEKLMQHTYETTFKRPEHQNKSME
jgi:hypothetical protein